MREIARAFNIRGNDRGALKELVRSLEAEGAIDSRRTRRRPAGTLPSVTVLEVDGLDSGRRAYGPAHALGRARSGAADHARPRTQKRSRAGGGRSRARAAQARAGRRLPGSAHARARCRPTPGGRGLSRHGQRRRRDRAGRAPRPPRRRGACRQDRRRAHGRAGGRRNRARQPPRPDRRQGGRAAGRCGLARSDQPRRDPRPRPADTLPRRGAGGGRASDGTGTSKAAPTCGRCPW